MRVCKKRKNCVCFMESKFGVLPEEDCERENVHIMHFVRILFPQYTWGLSGKILKKKAQQAHSIRYFSAFSSYCVLACWQMVCVSKFGFDHDHGLALCVESCLICRLLCRLTYIYFLYSWNSSSGVELWSFFWKLMDAVCVLYVFPLWKERYMIFCTYSKIIAIK